MLLFRVDLYCVIFIEYMQEKLFWIMLIYFLLMAIDTHDLLMNINTLKKYIAKKP